MLTESKIVRLLAPLFEGEKVVVGNQNAPAPNKQYVVVSLIHSEIYATAEYDRSNQTIIEYDDTDYRVQFVGPDAAMRLRRARGLANFEEFSVACAAEDCVVIRWHDVQYVPMLEENGRWSERASVDITVRHRMITRRKEDNPDGWIETADVTGRVINGKS